MCSETCCIIQVFFARLHFFERTVSIPILALVTRIMLRFSLLFTILYNIHELVIGVSLLKLLTVSCYFHIQKSIRIHFLYIKSQKSLSKRHFKRSPHHTFRLRNRNKRKVFCLLTRQRMVINHDTVGTSVLLMTQMPVRLRTDTKRTQLQPIFILLGSFVLGNFSLFILRFIPCADLLRFLAFSNFAGRRGAWQSSCAILPVLLGFGNDVTSAARSIPFFIRRQ
ncbi:membrane protein [gut metagenome]|uniref:Membrane protein n=1 Tax=gut metagenome TaxID=749906 RepID=J9GY66_9ZZZZ